MDRKGSAGPLYQDTRSTLAETEDLLGEWRRRDPRVQYALCPRFAISCTTELLEAARALQERDGLLVHTHASESLDEIAMVRKLTGMDNVAYFKKIGLLNRRTVLAHGVHLAPGEAEAIVKAGASVAHCPSSNLKLASGIAPVGDYLRMGMTVCLGADGAPCNNSLDPFLEMRLAALIQKPLRGPREVRAQEAFAMATALGARALGAESEIGSLEEGKRADVAIVRRSHPSVATVADPYSALVYSCLGRDVRDVWTNGREIVRGGEHQAIDAPKAVARARSELKKLVARL
jgi:cytosine/adenosine deaminase-related metal-dependent hydrolase